jgi:hypothetical protein
MMDVIDNQLTLHDASAAHLNADRFEQVSASHIQPCLDDPWYFEGRAPVPIAQRSLDTEILPASPSDVRGDKELRV